MGLIVFAFMVGIPGHDFLVPAAIGLLGAVIGSIISTRLMIRSTRKFYGERAEEPAIDNWDDSFDVFEHRAVRSGGFGARMMSALLEGGQTGVQIGFSIIPGVLIICTLITLLTNQPTDALPGVGFIPWLGDKLDFIIQPLFGFSSAACISVPLTALGSAGAAIGIIPNLVSQGLAGPGDIMSSRPLHVLVRYLSTHVAMMDTFERANLLPAIRSHTIGGLCGGVAAWLYVLLPHSKFSEISTE